MSQYHRHRLSSSHVLFPAGNCYIQMKTMWFASKKLYFLLCFIYCPFCSSNRNAEELCGMDKQCLLDQYKHMLLPRRDPVQIGHLSRISLGNEHIVDVKTLSLKPPVFEIRNFLSGEECDNVIAIAKAQGLQLSSVTGEDTFEEDKYFSDEDDGDLFGYYDSNKDGSIDLQEITNLFDTELDFSADKEDILSMFKELNLDKNDDMLLSSQEFAAKDIKTILKFISNIKKRKPYTKSRNSNQTWLDTNFKSSQVLHAIRKRLQKLTNLPMITINSSESLQVVSYEHRGHYNCHTDSDEVEVERKCCHFEDESPPNCRICRYMTVLYFLSDVEEGGETAFPVANNATFDEEVFSVDMERTCNLGLNCHKSKLRVRPEKGKAVLWYNHEVDPDTGWLGKLDHYSYHGGCDVIKGVKWIANNWISVSENRTEDVEFWVDRYLEELRSEANEATTYDIPANVGDRDDQIFKSVEDDDDMIIDSIFNSVESNYDHNEL